MLTELLVVIIMAWFSWSLAMRPTGLLGSGLAAAFGGSVTTFDDRLSALLDVADRYYREKNYLAAEKAYLRVLKLDHRNRLAYKRLGFVYMHFGNTADAIECLRIVVEGKGSASAYHNLAMALFKNRDFAEAATNLEKANNLDPTLARYVTLARLYRILSDYPHQLTALQKAAELEPDSIELMQLLAEAHIHNNDEKTARALFRRIANREPENMRAKEALAK